jgi:hypothetical protein
MALMNATLLKAPNKRKRSNLRLPPEVEDQVDRVRRKRPGKVSRNTWILEAIQEKLARENAANDKKINERAAND